MVRICAWSILLLAILGCSKSTESQRNYSLASESATAGVIANPAVPIPPPSISEVEALDADGRQNPGTAASGHGPPTNRGIRRKIVYTADLDLAVGSFDGVPERVTELAGKFEGYIARSDMQGSAGHSRGGQWTLRIPAENLDRFLLAAKELGEIRRSSSNSQDVSAEYFDIEARIRNKKQEEDRLLKHLDTSTKRLDEILTIEREISRVRGEVEQLTGRLKLLHDVSTLATVNLRIEELSKFVPEPASTYGDRVAQAWAGSIRRLSGLGQTVSIALVVLTPWLVTFGVPLMLPSLIWLRRYRRRAATVL